MNETLSAQDELVERIVRRMPGCTTPNCAACQRNREDAARFVSEAMALAYREAATLAETQADEKHAWIRKQSGFYVQYEDGGMTAQAIHTLRRFASELRALATALEEGTPQ